MPSSYSRTRYRISNSYTIHSHGAATYKEALFFSYIKYGDLWWANSFKQSMFLVNAKGEILYYKQDYSSGTAKTFTIYSQGVAKADYFINLYNYR